MKKIYFAIIVIVLIVLYCVKSYVPYNGIDISHHNPINWNEIAKDSNIKFVYIKATEGGNYKDKLFQRYVSNANRIGLHVGAYHYFRTNVSGAKQFKNFSESIDNVEYDLIPVIDIECKYNDYSNREQVRSELRTFISLFEQKYHCKPIIYYGSYGILRTILPATHSCPSWIRTMKFLSFIPIGTIEQIRYIYNNDRYIDANYCPNIQKILMNKFKD